MEILENCSLLLGIVTHIDLLRVKWLGYTCFISRQWHRIRVIQLFVEHLVTKFKDMMPFVNRLNLVSNWNM